MTHSKRKKENKVISLGKAYCEDCGKEDCIEEVRYECLGCTRCKTEHVSFRGIDKFIKAIC
jgi:predicted Zn-ribbon and HTH transcriptional regulator